jgi:hypothetical protein
VPRVRLVLYSSTLNLQSLKLSPHILQSADGAGALVVVASAHGCVVCQEGVEGEQSVAAGGGKGEESKGFRGARALAGSLGESGGRPP